MKVITCLVLFLSLFAFISTTDTCECSGLNEHYGSGTVCDTVCTNLDIGCRIQTFAPVKRCYCNEGYARDKWGICVPISECKKV